MTAWHGCASPRWGMGREATPHFPRLPIPHPALTLPFLDEEGAFEDGVPEIRVCPTFFPPFLPHAFPCLSPASLPLHRAALMSRRCSSPCVHQWRRGLGGVGRRYARPPLHCGSRGACTCCGEAGGWPQTRRRRSAMPAECWCAPRSRSPMTWRCGRRGGGWEEGGGVGGVRTRRRGVGEASRRGWES